MPVEAPYVLLGQLATVLFFALLGALCVAAWADSYLANFSFRNNKNISFRVKKSIRY
jgi:hypothetical protein